MLNRHYLIKFFFYFMTTRHPGINMHKKFKRKATVRRAPHSITLNSDKIIEYEHQQQQQQRKN